MYCIFNKILTHIGVSLFKTLPYNKSMNNLDYVNKGKNGKIKSSMYIICFMKEHIEFLYLAFWQIKFPFYWRIFFYFRIMVFMKMPPPPKKNKCLTMFKDPSSSQFLKKKP